MLITKNDFAVTHFSFFKINENLRSMILDVYQSLLCTIYVVHLDELIVFI